MAGLLLANADVSRALLEIVGQDKSGLGRFAGR